MDYLDKNGDLHKYDGIISRKVFGTHRENAMFSIMIPTYKRVEYLRQSVESVISQTCNDYEIIVVDNNDDDESIFMEVKKLLEGFRQPYIVYYRNEKNIGVYGNTLRAALLSKGKYVVLLNDDDLLHPQYLEVVNAFIEKYGYGGVIGSEPMAFSGENPEMRKLPKAVHAFRVTKEEFFFGCSVTSPGLCYPREILYEIYNAHEPLLMGDQIIQYKGLEKYGLTFIAFPLALYRISDNMTLRDQVLTDMVVDMCGFRRQTSKRDLKLRVLMKLFYREYCAWYIENTLYFWKKRRLKKIIYERLHMERHDYYTRKQMIMNEIIDRIHLRYCRIHRKKFDYIESGDRNGQRG